MFTYSVQLKFPEESYVILNFESGKKIAKKKKGRKTKVFDVFIITAAD
jgi:hypothetical protein